VKDELFPGLEKHQKNYLDLINESFAPLPNTPPLCLKKKLRGSRNAGAHGQAVFGEEDPTAIKYRERLQQVVKENDGYTFSLYCLLLKKGSLPNKKEMSSLYGWALSSGTLPCPHTDGPGY
jgi:hypothetical protein